ncbi:hypothetical protein WICMUC_005399 [Wickerhamomyces mucosus]|uniref:Peroxisomal adenine nucleotide transporter 1 n=1 Tax=Wickerhamomyces mucosus TaxID=1378264 RepID=A0A9P8P819_9ASCO|nr:hypothetical protein WICMUC_005399 [Wickerhamomyces mucosus]
MSNIENAIYGTGASLIANTIVYPLDLAKTLIQTQTKEAEKVRDSEEPEDHYENTVDCIVQIYKNHGIHALYTGISTSLLSNAVQSFSYYYWYSFVRKSYSQLKKQHKRSQVNSTAEELLLGIVAAAIGQLFTTPINVISTRQQTDAKRSDESILETGKRIYEENSFTGFWRGLKVSLVLTINPAITYATYERTKRLIFPSKKILRPHENFTLGIISKMIATLLTQPLIISKAMLQKSHRYKSLQEYLIYLVRTEGWRSLWKGLLPQLSKTVLVQGFIFMFKDQLYLLFKSIYVLIKLKKSGNLKVVKTRQPL